MDPYTSSYTVRPSDIDSYGHVHYSVYIDTAAAMRYQNLEDRGFSAATLRKLGIGPVYTALTARFLRETGLGETLTFTYQLAGLSPSGRRWRVHHDILKPSGKKSVTLDIEGVVLDLQSRAPISPPVEFLAVFHQIPRSPHFEDLPERQTTRSKKEAP